MRLSLHGAILLYFRLARKEDFECVIPTQCIVEEDIMIRYIKTLINRYRVFNETTVLGLATPILVLRCYFHVSFLEDNVVLFKKDQLDAPTSGPLKDHKYGIVFQS